MDLRRSKSLDTVGSCKMCVGEEENIELCCLIQDHNSQSEYSMEQCLAIDKQSEVSSLVEDKLDTSDDLFDIDGKVSKMEIKIDTLNKMLQDQYKLMLSLRADVIRSRADEQDLTAATASEMSCGAIDYVRSMEQFLKLLEVSESTAQSNDRAKSLLDAIELKHSQRLDYQIRDILTKFLQSDELKDHLTSAILSSLKNVIRNCFSETFSKAYLPILEDSYRRLLKLVNKILRSAFNELEANSVSLFKSAHKTSRALGLAMEKHQLHLESARPSPLINNLQNILEEILHSELKEWREKLFQVLMSEMHSNSGPTWEDSPDDEDLYTPSSPPQPANPERSIIDQLMKSAEIKKQIKEGHINKSFEEALSSADLSLVMVACRAADPAEVFAQPCLLQQPVLMSLVQQLVTDMVHDTQLKCRYLEDSIINLHTTDPDTSAHLPLVVLEVRRHLTSFLQSYPSHVACRRITLIIMAANYLIK